MSQKGLLTVVSGFSGAGKGTLMKALLAKYADRYALSISATTRGPREGEQDGREYFFLKKEEFEQMIEEDALIEHAQYVGNYYGTPKKYVMEQREAGKDVLLEIEIQGALKVKEKFAERRLLRSLKSVLPVRGRRLSTWISMIIFWSMTIWTPAWKSFTI